jgi:hypothetical protein
MADVSMSDAGGVTVLLPTSPLPHKQQGVPLPTTQLEADLYANLKKLQRDLEFLTLQEVLPSPALPSELKADAVVGVH